MRISDWSSDVCSSDLLLQRTRGELDAQPSFMLLSAIVELELGGEAVAATWADRLLAEQPHNFTARRVLAAAEWADGDAGAAREVLQPIVRRPDADRDRKSTRLNSSH